MDLGIAGKTAVVTGASSGLGEAIASQLAAEGVNLVLFARREQVMQDLAARLAAQHGVKVSVVAGDMTKKDDVKRLAAAAEEAGGPDILVLNTGRPPVPMREVLDETDDERWEEGYRVQLWAAVMVIREIVPKMVARKWGRVIAVTSGSVKQPIVKHALSTVFRAGLTGALKHLANEVAASGVTVNAVMPLSIATRSLRGSFEHEDRAKRVPMGRLGEPEEFAAVVTFLASQNAGFVTGASVPVDGGTVGSLV